MQYRFKFSLGISLFCVVLIGVFASLSAWQYLRAEEKKRLQTSVDTMVSQEAINLEATELTGLSNRDLTYRRVSLQGVYDVENQFLIDNIVHQGKPGYYVMTPLKIANFDLVFLVNRGWVPLGNDRRVLPLVDVPGGAVTVVGQFVPFRSKPFFLDDKMNPVGDHQSVWLYIDKEYFRQMSGYSLYDLVIRLDASAGGGYVRQWPSFDAKASMHIGYSIQWLVFAVFVFIAFIGLSVKKSGK